MSPLPNATTGLSGPISSWTATSGGGGGGGGGGYAKNDKVYFVQGIYYPGTGRAYNDKKTVFCMTNDDWAAGSITLWENEPDMETSGTTFPLFTPSEILQKGYWSDFKIFDMATRSLTYPSSISGYHNNYCWDEDNPNNVQATGWSSGLWYAQTTTPSSTNNFSNSSLTNVTTRTPNTSQYLSLWYTYGMAAMDGIILRAGGGQLTWGDAADQWSRIRVFKSTDGGATFEEVYVKEPYSFGGYLGAYPDYDGGKFLMWTQDTTGANTGPNSLFSSTDGSSWTDEGETSGSGPGAPAYRGWWTVVYNKETEKFYRCPGSSTIYESSDGVSWSSSGSAQVSGSSVTLRNVCVMSNQDMLGFGFDSSTSADIKIYKFTRSGTSISWSSGSLLSTTTIGTFNQWYYSYSAIYGPFGNAGGTNG